MNDLLKMSYDDVIQLIQQAFQDYHPTPVRRVWIEKPGKKEKRPLGIPSIVDRIIQELVRMVIEPILEAQFFDHSYGFRPMRDATHAIARVQYILWQSKCTYAVEGDIKEFFDHMNHNLLLKKLWEMGIRDKRLLMIIKKMLKALIPTNGVRVGTARKGSRSVRMVRVAMYQPGRTSPNGDWQVPGESLV
jgi:retron-type reverse transcriptase